jgi:hypothetical protein
MQHIQYALKRYIAHQNSAIFKINIDDDTEDILNWRFC